MCRRARTREKRSFVVLEVRRLDEHARAVGQLPFRDADRSRSAWSTTILPGAGGVATSGALETESVYAAPSRARRCPAPRAAPARVGNLAAGLLRRVDAITRFSLLSHLVARAFTSRSWMPGTSC